MRIIFTRKLLRPKTQGSSKVFPKRRAETGYRDFFVHLITSLDELPRAQNGAPDGPHEYPEGVPVLWPQSLEPLGVVGAHVKGAAEEGQRQAGAGGEVRGWGSGEVPNCFWQKKYLFNNRYFCVVPVDAESDDGKGKPEEHDGDFLRCWIGSSFRKRRKRHVFFLLCSHVYYVRKYVRSAFLLRNELTGVRSRHLFPFGYEYANLGILGRNKV